MSVPAQESADLQRRFGGLQRLYGVAGAQRIRAAALAPADPSGQDRAVAAQATQMEQQARVELAQQRREESSGNDTGKVGSFYSAQGNRNGQAVNTYA